MLVFDVDVDFDVYGVYLWCSGMLWYANVLLLRVVRSCLLLHVLFVDVNFGVCVLSCWFHFSLFRLSRCVVVVCGCCVCVWCDLI